MPARKPEPEPEPSQSLIDYCRRAKTADLVLENRHPRTSVAVSVYWPGEGYGIGEPCRDLRHAEEVARRVLALGYGRVTSNQVHIIETTTRIIEVSIEP